MFKRPDIRLLCTQATEQCREAVLDNRDAVLQQFRSQANADGYSIIGSKQGCPCAGTVIIELSDEVRVLQPEKNFHLQSIIEPHFKEHKCNIADDPMVDQMNTQRAEVQTH